MSKLAVLAAFFMPDLGRLLPKPESDWKSDPERLAKAQAKRQRKLNRNKMRKTFNDLGKRK